MNRAPSSPGCDKLFAMGVDAEHPGHEAGLPTVGVHKVGRRGVRLWAAIGLPLAVPVVCWWAIGDLSFRPDDPDSLDYMYRQPYIAPGVELAIGLAASVVALVSFVVLVRGTRARLVDRRWWVPLFIAAFAGLLAAIVERSVTAGVVGANIGGSLLFLLGIPAVVFLLIVALALAIFVAVTKG